ncbi:MAG: cytochrome D ubiquinol oxidase subunit II [Nitrospinaceae bacterium]|nr:LOG family protein [Nitrospinaceae bacterium]NIR55121.1 LOG family protein [Nitrospinaceae bacterium]NIS85542.1 LOG family protein [Nitrospinaceae bacterium]NIT82376.1 LOG family protein [Nitrospinaceae bacterium]NIU44589.1 LOG family protein [Nitrospinaceae bacterium]
MAKSNYSVGDPKAEKMIQELVDYCGNPVASDILNEILTTVVKMGLEHQDRGDFKLTNTTFKELRHAYRIFLPYRKKRKVVVFGSARAPESDPNYRLALDTSKALADIGHMIITGAGGGVMEAANLGAGRGNSFGINIRLPQEQRPNLHIQGDSKLMQFKYFFTRKLMFIKESDATLLFPGGFGTLDEGFETLTLFQTGKCMPRPILLAEAPGGTYWESLVRLFDDELLARGYISSIDMNLFHIVHSVEEAVHFLEDYYRYYHSLRYVKGATVLRFTRPLTPAIVEYLNHEFLDIVREGRFVATEVPDPEIPYDEFPELPRLVFQFNKQHFGRLNEMILWINRNLH